MFTKKDKIKFDAKTLLNEETGCLEWQAAVQQPGLRKQLPYGIIYTSQGQMNAHRFIWRYTHGDIPADLCVMHTCDNPRCVNINHLKLGTRRDNVQDMIQKNRRAIPQKGQYVIDHCDAGMIKVLQHYCSRKAIADYLGCKIHHVDGVILGRTYYKPITKSFHYSKKYVWLDTSAYDHLYPGDDWKAE